MRRWVAMLALCATLLGGVVPTLACAFSCSDGCCPSGSQNPCSFVSVSALDCAQSNCCDAAPALTRVHAASAARIRLEPNSFLHTPVPVAVSAWVLAGPMPEATRGTALLRVLAYRDNESLTYLRTARLRL